MRVKLFAADSAGCGYYRMRLPGAAAQAGCADVEITVVESIEDEGALVIRLAGRIGDTHVTSVDDPECDVIVLQRPMNRQLVEAIPLIQAWGTAVVVEVDDDFSRVHPKNPAWKGIQPHLSPDNNLLWFNLAAQMADLVTVSTPALTKRYGAHGRVRELPNYIPESYLSVKRETENECLELGWPGNAKVHPGDLKVVGNSVLNLVQEGYHFRAIGTKQTFTDLKIEGAFPLLGRTTLVDWVSLEEYPAAVAQIDVGIAPLALTPFNRAKSWLKGLEYAALGIPFVASDLPEYRKLQRLGAGSIASVPSSWETQLRHLIEDDEHRALCAEEGRAVASELTIEKHAWRWLQAWADAISCRRAA